MTGIIVWLVLALLLMFWTVGAYQRLTGMHRRCRAAYDRLDAQLRQRHALIPVLVDATRTELGAHPGLMETLLAARNDAAAASAAVAGNPADPLGRQLMVQSEAHLAATVARFIVLLQASESLQASEHLRHQSDALASGGHRIAHARQAYNDLVIQHNAAVRQFPASIIALLFGLRAAEAWHADDGPVDRRQPRPE